MAYALIMLAVLLLMVCALWLVCAVLQREEQEDECALDQEDDPKRRERDRQAHYMRNFWSYDGSPQQEWDEESVY